jgi:hypothetical protein
MMALLAEKGPKMMQGDDGMECRAGSLSSRQVGVRGMGLLASSMGLRIGLSPSMAGRIVLVLSLWAPGETGEMTLWVQMGLWLSSWSKMMMVDPFVQMRLSMMEEPEGQEEPMGWKSTEELCLSASGLSSSGRSSSGLSSLVLSSSGLALSGLLLEGEIKLS